MGDHEENASWDAQGCHIYKGTPSKVLKFVPVAILYFCKHVGHVELCRHVGPRR